MAHAVYTVTAASSIAVGAVVAMQALGAFSRLLIAATVAVGWASPFAAVPVKADVAAEQAGAVCL